MTERKKAPSPNLQANALHKIEAEAALALFDLHLGPIDGWASPLIRYRRESDFQADWREEVGHWLATTEQHGFLKKLLPRIQRAKGQSLSDEVDPNDPLHRVLIQELAPAMVVHYLLGVGWTFEEWEPDRGSGVDVDICLRTPTGALVDIQVKAPDRPGKVINHRLVDGEYDSHVLTATENAAGQLPKDGPATKLIVVCAHRSWPLYANPTPMISEFVGSTIQFGRQVTLPAERLGKFWQASWGHVAGIVMLDLVRSVERSYGCTVLLNPNASVAASDEWFPNARVCVLEDSVFRWVRGEPPDDHGLPDGTPIISPPTSRED